VVAAVDLVPRWRRFGSPPPPAPAQEEDLGVGEGHCRRFGLPPPSASMILGPVVASNTITVVAASSIAPEEDLGAGEKVADLANRRL
jgi:hypothetical protein